MNDVFRTLNQLVCVERCTNRAVVYLFVWLSPLLQSQLFYDKRIFFFRQWGVHKGYYFDRNVLSCYVNCRYPLCHTAFSCGARLLA